MTNMSRPTPLEYGTYYHIYNRGNGREDIFREPSTYAYFLKLYAKHVEPVADTYAYCLLRNHFHLLVRIKEEQAIKPDMLSSAVPHPSPTQQWSNFFNGYAKGYNKTYRRTGSLFQRPFRRVCVPTDTYLVNLVRYIHFNPQKHGFVADFREYPYSSYRAIYTGTPSSLKRDQVLEWFGGLAGFEATHQIRANETNIAQLIEEDLD